MKKPAAAAAAAAAAVIFLTKQLVETPLIERPHLTLMTVYLPSKNDNLNAFKKKKVEVEMERV